MLILEQLVVVQKGICAFTQRPRPVVFFYTFKQMTPTDSVFVNLYRKSRLLPKSAVCPVSHFLTPHLQGESKVKEVLLDFSHMVCSESSNGAVSVKPANEEVAQIVQHNMERKVATFQTMVLTRLCFCNMLCHIFVSDAEGESGGEGGKGGKGGKGEGEGKGGGVGGGGGGGSGGGSGGGRGRGAERFLQST